MSYSSPNVYLTFQGVSFSSGTSRSFNAMVGPTPPTVTGGYANWMTADRPLQRGLTIFTGYDPAKVSVSIRMFYVNAPGKVASGGGGRARVSESTAVTGVKVPRPIVQDVSNLGGWLTDDTTAQLLEADIDSLEWMAGANFRAGPSPIVYVWSYGNGGGLTDLFPPQYASAAGVPWVITGLEWGQSYRNPNGYRIWQEATITLEGYVNTNKAPAAVSTSPGSYFVARTGFNTIQSIVSARGVNSPTTDHNILGSRIKIAAHNNPCSNNRNVKLKAYGLRQSIPIGTKVWIPGHTIS
jgi:hypothetical protein